MFENVMHMEPNGWIPDFIVQTGQQRACKNSISLPAYIMDGTIPEQF